MRGKQHLLGLVAAGVIIPALVVTLLVAQPGNTDGGRADAAVAPNEVAPPISLPTELVASDLQPANNVAFLPAARRADLPMSHVWQSWNNCGPASVTMLLSSLGVSVSQEQARLALRGTNIARGMGPQGVNPWVNSLFGLNSFNRNNGTEAMLKTLLTNGFAPMVTQWLDDHSRIAHWRAIRGYDDDAGVFYASDPMRGANVALSYEWFDNNWRPFQYRYLVIYKPQDEALLRSIIGTDWHDIPSRANYLTRAKNEALNIGNSEAWLSYGEAAFQAGQHEEAVTAFERGMLLGSATGVFNVRSSYPTALRLLGREQDARTATGKLTALTSVPNTGPDQNEIRQMIAAGGFPEVVFRLGEVPPTPARLAADPVLAR